MLQVALLLLFVVHALIHGMGFAKAFELATFKELSLPISRPLGVVWLVAGVLLLFGAATRSVNLSWWWIPTLFGVVLSQFLILFFWADSKFGTIPNVLLVLATIVGFGQWRFERMVQRDVASMHGEIHSQDLVAEEDLAPLPSSVRHWLRRAGVVGKPRVSIVKLQQRGRMQTEPEGRWMDFQATQWVTTKPPGFVWFADVSAYPGAFLYGRDKYQSGRGTMTISILALVSVVEAEGPKVDQASMHRFLGEMALYPSAALEPYIQWEEAGELAARAVMTYGGVTASGLFRFDEIGNLLSFEAKRYRDVETEDWLVEAKDEMRTSSVTRYSSRWDVSWRLDSGDWTWLELEVFNVTHDGERH